jgi:ATP/maltotriose-dependent transcriptional regulator MalT
MQSIVKERLLFRDRLAKGGLKSFLITMEVLALIAEGKSNQEISAELFLGLNTFKRHASVLPGHFIRSICG